MNRRLFLFSLASFPAMSGPPDPVLNNIKRAEILINQWKRRIPGIRLYYVRVDYDEMICTLRYRKGKTRAQDKFKLDPFFSRKDAQKFLDYFSVPYLVLTVLR